MPSAEALLGSGAEVVGVVKMPEGSLVIGVVICSSLKILSPGAGLPVAGANTGTGAEVRNAVGVLAGSAKALTGGEADALARRGS